MKKLLITISLGLLALSTLAAQTVDSSPRAMTVFTVGTLPTASSWTNKIALVTDGASAGDCTVGSGSTRVLCVSNGSAWAAASGGGGTSVVLQTPPITVSAAQVKTVNASPVTIVAAQGAGTYIELVSAVVEYVCASCTQYTSGNNLVFKIGGAWASTDITSGNFDGIPSTGLIPFSGLPSSSVWIGDRRNTALTFTNDSGPEYATGTGTLIIQANYIVHTGL